MATETLLTVGELARRTGITVRTLHHYDRLGLVTPTGRSNGNYRLYGADDVKRLQAVRSLQAAGFALKRIKAMFESKDFAFEQAIALHLDRLNAKIALEQSLAARLAAMRDLLGLQRAPTIEDVVDLLEITTNVERFKLDPETEQKLARHWARQSRAEIAAVEAEWPTLIAKVRASMNQGADPKTPEVQALARRWMELVGKFTAGIDRVADDVAQRYRQDHARLKQQHGETVPDPEMFPYIRAALA